MLRKFCEQSEKTIQAIERIFLVIASVGALTMMVMITVDVTLRYLLSMPIKGSYEISENILMISIVFFALSRSNHVRVTLVVSKLPWRIQRLMSQLMLLVSIILFFLMTWQSGFMFYVSWSQKEIHDGILSFPLYPGRMIVLMGVLLLSLKLVMRFLKSLGAEREEELWT